MPACAPYFFASSWGLFVFLSFLGWGYALQRMLFGPTCPIDLGQRAAWGIALSVLAGGLFNLLGIISRTTLLLYLATGFLGWLLDPAKKHGIAWEHPKDWVVMAMKVSVLFLLALQYATWVATSSFNWHDDFHAYLVFPQKMLQAGSLGADYFSDRRVTSSFGGQSFLQTFILCVLPEKNINILDAGIGPCVFAALLWGHFQSRAIPPKLALSILLFFLVIPLPRANVSGLMIPAALFLSLYCTLDWDGLRKEHGIANACVIALLASAICALKMSLIPACGIFFGASYLFYAIGSAERRPAIREFFLALIGTGLFLLPWMISMHRSAGTLWYPVLGRGFYEPSWQSLFSAQDLWAPEKIFRLLLRLPTDLYFLALVLFSVIGLKSHPGKIKDREAAISFSIAACLGAAILFVLHFGFETRYALPFAVPAILILGTQGVLNTKKHRWHLVVPLLLALAIPLHTLWRFSAGHPAKYFKSNPVFRNIAFGMRNAPLVAPAEALRYRRMQQSVPTGATLLTRLVKPFLLDFRRNRVLIADDPGSTIVPRGMPFFRGSEALAQFILSRSIRYVAYSYQQDAYYRKKDFLLRLTDPNPWYRIQSRHTFDFQDNLQELGKTRRRIYDDGENFVVDLLSA